MSKIFRMRPERSSPPALDGLMKEQLQFVIRVLNARLSDQTPHRSSMAGKRLVSRLSDRFAAQETRP